MHPAAAFRETDRARLAGFVAARAFGVIVAVEDSFRPVAAHALLLRSADAASFQFHLARANPASAALRRRPRALAVVSGPDAYVSPNWYGAADQVPTWNYVSAEAEGPVRALAREETIALLDRLSARFEADLAPDIPWSRAKMDPRLFQRMVDQVDGFELTPERFEGVRKLSQNKPADQSRRVADRLAAAADPGARAIAALMNGEA